jgi:dihydropteroate synthase
VDRVQETFRFFSASTYHSDMAVTWSICGKDILINRTLIMGVLNVTPDSFSDGDQFASPEKAIAHAEQMVADGADFIDVGGESTRPGSSVVGPEEELQRVLPVIRGLVKRISIPISIDTTKSAVAAAAVEAGATIINDVSALRFDQEVAGVAKDTGAGLVLMHSRGTPGAMHNLPPVEDILGEVTGSLGNSISIAERKGVHRKSIVIDPGIGFGKSLEQNLELIAKLDQVAASFPDLPILIGTSRKSFLGKILDGAPANERLYGTMATVTAAVLKGAHIIRVHDVKAAVETVRVTSVIKAAAGTVSTHG